MAFAIAEIRTVIGKFQNPISTTDPNVRYACALLSELAYYSISEYEIDDSKKRAKLFVPCLAHQALMLRGYPTSSYLHEQLRYLDFQDISILSPEDSSIVILALMFNGYLFLSFRGTKFLYDWGVNIKCNLTSGRREKYHSGIYTETQRILNIVRAKIDAYPQIKHVFVTGHSLGGAVAAVAAAELLEDIPHKTVCIFGAPRYCNNEAYAYQQKAGIEWPTVVCRPGDEILTIPPRSLGYEDHPNAVDRMGYKVDPPQFGWPKDPVGSWAYFLWSQYEGHSMEGYRFDAGEVAQASDYLSALTSYPEIQQI